MPTTRSQALTRRGPTEPSDSNGARPSANPTAAPSSPGSRGAGSLPAFPRPVLRLFALILVAAALAFFVSQLAAAAPLPGGGADLRQIMRETHRPAGWFMEPAFRSVTALK